MVSEAISEFKNFPGGHTPDSPTLFTLTRTQWLYVYQSKIAGAGPVANYLWGFSREKKYQARLSPCVQLQYCFPERRSLGTRLIFSHISMVARWSHSRFEFHSSKFLLCKSHISPVQISHFSNANFTFLQCKFHISPVQISHFSSANLAFLQCKSHISPVQNPTFPILCVYLMHMLMNFILSKWPELVFAKIEFSQ